MKIQFKSGWIKLLTLGSLSILVILCSCKKSDSAPSNNLTKENFSFTRNFNSENINISYSFSTKDSSATDVKISGDYSIIEKTSSYYKPEATQYFTVRVANNENNDLQYLIYGKYHTTNDSLEIYYLKYDLNKPYTPIN